MSDVQSVSSPRIPPDERYTSRRRRLKLGAVAAVATLLAAGAVHFALWEPARLSDAADAFGEEMSGVMGKIQAHNAEVLKKNPTDYVTIVVLLPLSADWQEAGMSKEAMRHALQGSYLAQLWHNETQSQASHVRLLVGSSGPDDWEDTVKDLRARVASDHIAAVVGLGASTSTTFNVVTRLSEDKVAMVAAVLTSDKFKGQAGFVRLAPLNSDQATAGAQFALRAGKKIKAVIVEDTNSSQHYAKTLHDTYASVLKDAPNVELMEGKAFDSSTSTAGAVMGINADQLCTWGADYVFYAGRAEQLPSLLDALSRAHGCVGREVKIISGDDTSELDKGATWTDGDGKLQLYYTALAPKENVTNSKSVVPEAIKSRFVGNNERAYGRLFPEEKSMDDGDAIMHHDAVYVAIKAIDNLLPSRVKGKQLLPEDVAGALRSGSLELGGASGHIKILKDGTTLRPELPLMRRRPDHTTTVEDWVSLKP